MILAKVDKLYSQKHWCLSWKTGRNTWPKGLEPISLSQMTASNKEPVAVHNVSKPFSTKMILLLVSDSNPAPTCCFTMHVGHVPSLRWSPPPPQHWWTYPWQGLLLVQCTLGLESRVPGAVGEEGTAWGGRGWLREFPETPEYPSWKDPIKLTNSRPLLPSLKEGVPMFQALTHFHLLLASYLGNTCTHT